MIIFRTDERRDRMGANQEVDEAVDDLKHGG
jgi:hypothetical protein